MAASYQMLFELNAALGGGFTSAFTQGSQQIENMKSSLQSLNSMGSTGDMLNGISAALETAGIVKGLEAVYDTLKECAEEAARFETAMAGVKRTVGGSDDFISGLGESFKRLSTEVPITADELAGIATTAGQLGIAQENVETFTMVMAQLGTTTDLSADSAATMLAQFANITGTTDYERLGSTVASLGDATATTASKVVEMSQGMAAAASQAGFSETDILAVAAAVGSLGIEAASGSTSMSTLISTLYKATETGDKLADFASVAGMTAEQFKQSWQEDAIGTMNAFIQGLNDTERNGRSAVVILDELGIKNVRQTKAILGLASAGDLLTNTISQANQAWNENAALSEKAGVMYNTTEAKLTMLNNAASNLKIAVGDALTPVVSGAAEKLTGLVEPLAEFIEANPAIVQGITTFVGAIGVATAAVTGYTAVTKLAAAANALFSASIPGMKIILGVAAGLGVLVAGVGLLTAAYNDAHPSFAKLDADFDSLNEKAKEQQQIIDLAEEYKTLTKEISDMESNGVGKITEKIDISSVKKSDLELLKEIADNNGYTVNADGTVTQTLDITGVSKRDLSELEKLKTSYVDTKAKLVQELQMLGVKDVEKNLDTYLAFKTNTKEGRYALKQQLEIDGAENLTDAKVNQLKQLMDTVQTKEGKLTQKLERLGFDSATISSLGYSSMEAFVEAVQSGKIITSADGTLTQKIVMDDIKPEAVRQIEELKGAISNEKATLEQDLKILGVEDVENKMETYLSFKTNTADGVHSLQQQLELDGVENISTENLNHLKEFIRNIQTKEGKLTQKLETSGFDETTIGALGYSSMEDFVAAVEAGKVVVDANGTITQVIDVSGDLAELKEANEQAVALAEAQNEAAAASDELAAKRERLKAVTEGLRDASGGLITATDEETEALNRQIDAFEEVAKARKSEYTSQALDSIKKQSKLYVESIQAEKTATEQLTKANAQSDFVQEIIKAGNAAEYVRAEYEALTQASEAYEGPNWVSDEGAEADALREKYKNLQDVINLLGNTDHGFAMGDMVNMGYAVRETAFDTENLTESWSNANAEAVKYAHAVADNDKIQQEYLQNLINGVAEGTLGYEDLQAALEGAFSEYENGGEIVADTMEQVKAGVEAAKAAAEGAGDSAQTESEKAVSAVQSIIAQVEELTAAYEEAKEAAKKALDGRFGLFDEVGKAATSQSTADMEKNMAAQKAYWDQYNTNLQKALDNGLSKEIANQLADGSAESAATLATLASSSKETIAEINSSFAEVEQSKESLASTIADMQTGFSEGLAALKEELDSTIEELDKNAEAAEAAKATMDAYVEGIQAGGEEATAEAGRIAGEVTSTLESIPDKTVHIGFEVGEVPSIGDIVGKVFGRHAIGTDYAHEGLAMVGEEGPELVYMGGGEKVLTANETVRALSGAAEGGSNIIEVQFSPVYNVNGGSNTAEIRSMLQEQSQNLRDQVEDIMQEVLTDHNRTAYA